MCVVLRSVPNMNEDILCFIVPAQVKRRLKSVGSVGIDERIAALIESGNYGEMVYIVMHDMGNQIASRELAY